MRQRHVVVLFQHRLFGEAIARVLGEHPQISITTLPLESTTPEQLTAVHPDAIVLEDDPSPGGIRECLLDVAPALTVVAGPRRTPPGNERHEMIEATAAEIIARIVQEPVGSHGRRTHVLRGSLPEGTGSEP
jgi:hypothetical protein